LPLRATAGRSFRCATDSTSQQWLIRFLGGSRDQGFHSRLESLSRLAVFLSDPIAATAGNDGRGSSVELTPSNAATAIWGKNRFN
jgi:hypothetical protein